MYLQTHSLRAASTTEAPASNLAYAAQVCVRNDSRPDSERLTARRWLYIASHIEPHTQDYISVVHVLSMSPSLRNFCVWSVYWQSLRNETKLFWSSRLMRAGNDLQEQIELLLLVLISKIQVFFFLDKCFKVGSCFVYYLPLSRILFRDQRMILLSSFCCCHVSLQQWVLAVHSMECNSSKIQTSLNYPHNTKCT